MEKAVEIPEHVLYDWQQKIAQGDEKAFRLFFDYFNARLVNFSFSLLQNKEVAVEISDAVFVKIWTSRSTFGQIRHINAYLYTAVKNSCLNFLSKKSKEQITDPFDFINIRLGNHDTPEQLMINEEMIRRIDAAIDSLPPRCKMVFKLVREDGLKYKEIAAILNISIKTVDAQMVIAIKKISDKIRSGFDHFPKSVKNKNFL